MFRFEKIRQLLRSRSKKEAMAKAKQAENFARVMEAQKELAEFYRTL